MTNETLLLTFLIIGGILGNWFITKRIVANTASLNAKMRKK
jgi:hypothetical protein